MYTAVSNKLFNEFPTKLNIVGCTGQLNVDEGFYCKMGHVQESPSHHLLQKMKRLNIKRN